MWYWSKYLWRLLEFHSLMNAIIAQLANPGAKAPGIARANLFQAGGLTAQREGTDEIVPRGFGRGLDDTVAGFLRRAQRLDVIISGYGGKAV